MTRLDIWNRALALLPHDRRIAAENEDSTEALRCRDQWDEARRSVLAAHDWGWATRQTDVCGGCPSGHSIMRYGFPRPQDAVRVVGVFDPRGRRVKTHAYNGMIAAEVPACFLRYIPDNNEPETWPPWFAGAVIAELAHRLAPEITGNAQTERRLDGLAGTRLAEAIRIDAAEVRYGGTDGKSFLRAREGGTRRWRDN